MASDSTLDISYQLYTWEDDRKLILRGWSLVFSILATLLLLSVVDGPVAYLQSPYAGYLGFWNNCKRHKCANVGQVTVLIDMSKGFIMLALALGLFLLSFMVLSFQPIFRRLRKMDLLFSFLSISIGFLIFLSLIFFVIDCKRLRPRPQVSYLMIFYLCWCASVLMLWAGVLSYLNHVGMWSIMLPTMDRRVSYLRWASRRSLLGLTLNQQSSTMVSEVTEDLSGSRNIQEDSSPDPREKSQASLDTTPTSLDHLTASTSL